MARARPTILAFVATLVVLGASACSSSPGNGVRLGQHRNGSTQINAPTGIDTSTSGAAGLSAPIGFGTITVTVKTSDGREIDLCLWLADSADQHQRGLMFVTDPTLGGKSGMLFRFAEDTGVGFWMKNTLLPLSIAYIDSQGGVVSTADMDPCPAAATSCPSYPPASTYRYAIEVPRGSLADLGIEAGARVDVGQEGCHTS
ncbi:MAG: DUF192 domain-containing protein [Acidimicrobiales bacterium]|nr:DUF192 domain-containing protein [Acidimicrobiales bacterium]